MVQQWFGLQFQGSSATDRLKSSAPMPAGDFSRMIRPPAPAMAMASVGPAEHQQPASHPHDQPVADQGQHPGDHLHQATESIRCWIHEDIKITVEEDDIKVFKWDQEEVDWLPLEWYGLHQELAHHQASEVLQAISDPDPRKLIMLMYQWNTNHQLREQYRISLLASIGVGQIRAARQNRSGIWPGSLRW